MRLTKDILGERSLKGYEGETATIEVGERKYRVSPELLGRRVSAIIGQSFGGGPMDSGLDYNRILAQTSIDASAYFDRGKRPELLMQSEISRHLDDSWLEGMTSFGETYEEGEKTDGTKSKVNSHELLKAMYNWMEGASADSSEVVFVAHPAHVYRVQEIGKKVGLEGGVFIPEEVVWPIDDLQEWVRNPESWGKRERLVRAHHWLKGWVPREF